MKKIIIIAIASISTIAVGCSKRSNIHPSFDTSHSVPRPQLRDGGEDDDRPTVMHVTTDVTNVPVSDSYIMYTNDVDTIEGSTDGFGKCLLTLPYFGDWNLSITHVGYWPMNTRVHLVDSFKSEIDTLQIL